MKNRIADLHVIFPDNIDEEKPIQLYISCILDNSVNINNLPAEIYKEQIVLCYPAFKTNDEKTTISYQIISKKLKEQLVIRVLEKYAERIKPGVDFKLRLLAGKVS